jgi:hypothetical protein
MENMKYCQSCGMPLNTNDVKGTEKDGLKTNEYCMYCYENGVFKNPMANLDEMRNTVEIKMTKSKLPHYMIKKAVNILPALKRWNRKYY